MNIRVVREAGGLGDIVRIIPALRGLREKYPDARIWLFIPAEYRPLVEGWFDEFCPTPWQGRRPRDAPVDERRWPYLNVGVKFDLSINLYCPAFRHEHDRRGDVWLDRIDLFCQACGVNPSNRLPQMNLARADALEAEEYLATHRLKERGKLVALQPFSTDPARNWPLENWLRLAAELERRGHTPIVLDCCGGRTARFAQHRVIGRPIGFVAALLKECDLLIAPDSGLGHLAAAVGTPTVGLFASQSGPIMYRYYPEHTWIYPPWDGQRRCRWPCFWARAPRCSRGALVADGNTCAMLERIPVEETLQAVEERLSRRRPGAPVALPEMPHAAKRALWNVEKIASLRIPRRDFALSRLALVRAVADARPHLAEAYRVLRPGGLLYLAPMGQDQRQAIAEHGFEPCAATRQGAIPFRKIGTWSSPRRPAPSKRNPAE